MDIDRVNRVENIQGTLALVGLMATRQFADSNRDASAPKGLLGSLHLSSKFDREENAVKKW